MRQIWKYALEPRERTELLIPKNARVLSVQAQQGQVMIWALVDPSEPMETRRFVVVPTGQPFEESRLHYLGSVQLQDGRLVLHCFEDFTVKS